jgi:tetratricopeptide (TPR) repeat protein
MLALGFLLTGIACSSVGGRQAVTPDQWFDRANAAYAQGDLKTARQFYTQILEKDPEDIEARFKLGVIDYRQGQFAESRTHFLKVLSMAPEHRKATYNLGVIYSAEGALKNNEKANFFFDKYLSMVPEAPQRKLIMRWKAQQAAGKRREEKPVAVGERSVLSEPAPTEAPPGDLKQWLQQEAEQVGP